MSSNGAIHNAIEHLEKRKGALFVEMLHVGEALRALSNVIVNGKSNGQAQAATPKMLPLWLTAREMAKHRKISVPYVYELADEGKLLKREVVPEGRGGRHLLFAAK